MAGLSVIGLSSREFPPCNSLGKRGNKISLLTVDDRYPSVCYSADGPKLRDRLWEETIQELKPFGAAQALEKLKK